MDPRSLAIRADFRVGAVVPFIRTGIGSRQREKDRLSDLKMPKLGASMQLPRSKLHHGTRNRMIEQDPQTSDRHSNGSAWAHI